jgi:hypothetical protein
VARRCRVSGPALPVPGQVPVRAIVPAAGRQRYRCQALGLPKARGLPRAHGLGAAVRRHSVA